MRAFLTLLLLSACQAQTQTPDKPVIFMKRAVTLSGAEFDLDGDSPLSDEKPASVCLEGPPQRQCYTAPAEYKYEPAVEIIQLGGGERGLLFTALTCVGSGYNVHFALLQPGKGERLENLLPYAHSASNQAQYTFSYQPALSEEPIFLMAEFVWGPGEAHYDAHRYIISAYMRLPNEWTVTSDYRLNDQYMTAGKYDEHQIGDIFSRELPEILARLARVRITSAAESGQ
jgi:hypothetical protein